MTDINIHASTVRTHNSGTGHEAFVTTVICDRPLFKKDDTNWEEGSQNSRMQDAIETLLLITTGAHGQDMGFCAERYPLPNDAGCYVYKFESRCDHSG